MADKQAQTDLGAIEQRMIVASRIVALIRSLPKPVVAAVNGAAAGAGMNLALACDIRYATVRAKFVQSFVKIGLVPDWGGHHLLTRLLGTAAALEIALLGEAIDAERAYRLGIVNAIFPDAEFAEAMRARVAALAAGPPRAMAAIKRGIYFSTEHNLAETLGYEIDAQRTAFQSAEAREGLRAFLEKRPPKF
jgi:2-(1,2-epoxy-1,2-dihydrophenyl)acetyl-CoA isomerase